MLCVFTYFFNKQLVEEMDPYSDSSLNHTSYISVMAAFSMTRLQGMFVHIFTHKKN